MQEIFSHVNRSFYKPEDVTVEGDASTGEVRITLIEFGLDSLSHDLTLDEAIALNNALSTFLGEF